MSPAMIQRFARTTLAVASRALNRAPVGPAVAVGARDFSDNVTYSGGQPGVQGGFYGAGGARSQASPQ